MLGKRSILIFLLSVNIFGQNTLTDELKELKSSAEEVDLSSWTALAQDPQQNTLTEDTISLNSSALKKPESQDSNEEDPIVETQELGTIRYRSR